MGRDERTEHNFDPHAMKLGKQYLGRALGSYSVMGPCNGDGIAATYATIFVTTETGDHGLLMMPHSGDGDPSFLRKWKVSFNDMEAAVFRANKTALGDPGSDNMEAYYTAMDEDGPGSERLKTVQASFLTRFTNQLIPDPVLLLLLGPRSANFRVEEMHDGTFCATVNMERHYPIDPLTNQPTEVQPSTFKILQSNCVENPKKEKIPCPNMTTHDDKVMLMTGDRILNNVQDHGCRRKTRGKWRPKPRTFDEEKRPGGSRSYEDAENNKENARANKKRDDDSEEDDRVERRVAKARKSLDASLENVADRRATRSVPNGGNCGDANAADGAAAGGDAAGAVANGPINLAAADTKSD